MKVTGIVAEYNPFHKGHQYHLERARLETDADFVVVVLSGDFVQRGEPAILDKWSRTHMALMGGADLVLELPSFAAVGSAEYFAAGAISLFSAMGVVDHLSFGSESGKLDALSKLADFFCEEPVSYQNHLREELKKGASFPRARQSAFQAYCEETDLEIKPELLASPNNLLGIEYLKALRRSKSQIQPHTVVRVGSGYHDTSLDGSCFASASGIRSVFSSCSSLDEAADQIAGQIPDFALPPWKKCLGTSAPVFADDFSSLLHYRLLSFRDRAQLLDYFDVSEDLAERIFRIRQDYTSFSAFTSLLKTRQITYTRAARSLSHLLLGMKREQADTFFRTVDSDGYLRILGFRRNAVPLLSEIKKKSSFPMITKLADAKKQLSEHAFSALAQDLFCSGVYHAAIAQKYPGHSYNEYRHSPIILDIK